MFICIVCVPITAGTWKINYLPALEKRVYSSQEWYRHLDPIDDNYWWGYVTENTVPLFEIHKLLGSINEILQTHQLKRFMQACQHELKVKWRKVQHYPRDMESTDRGLLADLVWSRISYRLAGRLLHIYEVQRCLQSQNITLSLEQLVDCLVIWIWRNKIELQAGIEIKSLSKWEKVKSLKQKRYRCSRCLNEELEQEQYHCYSCESHCISCLACAQLGKVRSCSILIKVRQEKNNLRNESNHPEIQSVISHYKLSEAQASAVEHILNAILQHYQGRIKKESTLRKQVQNDTQLSYILWAVTGAGKTEMIFPLIHMFLEWDLKVLIAIPRRDVVQELEPRISKAFQDKKVVALYGGSEQVWEGGQIYIATTHQIIRFDQYFDLVILDEMDAFPYYNNKTLMRTIKRVQNKYACFVQLTATIPAKEKINMMFKRQKHVKVPVRYHQRALPIPQFKNAPSIISILKSNQLPPILHHIIEQSSKRGAVLFIFLQRKSYLQPFTQLLTGSFPQLPIAYTSAEDEERETKVKLFRERKITVLVTTSILERGVTIKKSDICIMDVHQKAYNRTAIVQMAGRAGRSIEDTNGFVYLLGTHKTKQVTAAIKEIKAMNLLAKRKGYLKEGN